MIFEAAFFNVKIEARAKNIVNTVKKWRPGRVSSSKNGHVFDLVNILKFKMWKGGANLTHFGSEKNQIRNPDSQAPGLFPEVASA